MIAWTAGACAAVAVLASARVAEGWRASMVVGRLRPTSGAELPVVGRVASWLAAAGIEIAPGPAALIVVVVPALVLTGAIRVGGLVLGGLVAGGLGILTAAAPRWSAARVERRARRALPAAVDDVARALATGLTIPQALAHAALRADPALAPRLTGLVASIEAGASVEAALHRWAAGQAHRGARLTAAALAVGARVGGAQAQALHGVAATLRDELALEAEARALASQARMSALVITVAPLGFVAFTTATDPRVAHFLFRTPPGWLVLVLGVVLDAVAALWMARLARVSV